MAVTYTFATATSSIPLSQLDANFATAITLGNTAVYLGNTTTSIGNLTLTNVTISNVATTFPNSFLANSTTTLGNATLTLGSTTSSVGNLTLSNVTISSGSINAAVTHSYNNANAVVYTNSSNVGTTSTALSFDGTNFSTTGTATASKLIPTGSSVTGNGLYLPATNSLGLSTNGTNALYIDSSQNVGIGTTSPSTQLQVSGTNAVLNITRSTKNIYVNPNYANGGVYGTLEYDLAMAFNTNGAERMRIDSSGNVLVGTTTVGRQNANATTISPANAIIWTMHSGTASGSVYIDFSYNGGQIGSISQNGTTGVLYNITSDYRLKDNATKITNGLETIQALNPVNFTWKPDGTSDSGFLAHEFQEILPRSVVGEKDAVDEEGKPVYQGMDNSGAIPYLVAAIQEQQTIINDLKARITILEGK